MTKVKTSSVSDKSEVSDERSNMVEETRSNEVEEQRSNEVGEAESDPSLSLVGRGFRPSVRREAIRRKLQQAKKKVNQSPLVPEIHFLISVG